MQLFVPDRFVGAPGGCGDRGDKGQSHGCIGNYTMLHFEGDGLYLENLTIGNYCNVDLEYPLDPSKNRPKRCKAVTQAQLGDVVGDRFHAKTVVSSAD